MELFWKAEDISSIILKCFSHFCSTEITESLIINYCQCTNEVDISRDISIEKPFVKYFHINIARIKINQNTQTFNDSRIRKTF